MYLKAAQGKHFKNFIRICDVKTQKDKELYDVIKKILYRNEYQIYGAYKGKSISESYLFNDFIFPSTFLAEIKEKLSLHLNGEEIYCENEEILHNNELDENAFFEWVRNSKFPDAINTSSPEYFFQQQSAFNGIKNFVSRVDISMGGGKTFISYLFAKYIKSQLKHIPEGKKILIILTQSNLVTQFYNEWTEFDSFFDDKLKIEKVTSNPKKIAECDVLIGHFKTIGGYDEDFLKEFHVAIFDEVHRAKAYTIRENIYNKLTACEYKFAMTGTMPSYKSLDFLHIGMMFGSTPVYIQTIQDNVNNKITTPVIVQALQIYYDEFKDFSTKLSKDKSISRIEKYVSEKKFVRTYEKRTNLLVKLFKHKQENSLIAVESVEYCEYLKTYLSEKLPNWRIEILHGAIPTKERESIVNDMRNCDSNFCIIGTKQLVATGLSIKSLQNIYNIEGGKSEILILQLLSRGNRIYTNKEFFTYFDFQDMLADSALKTQAHKRNAIFTKAKLETVFTKITI